jgi:sialidase-1
MERFVVSRDDAVYQAWPDVALTRSGALVCVFSECTHHGDRSYTRVMLTTSFDRGRHWTPKRPLSEPLYRKTEDDPFWDCARIGMLTDGRLYVVADRVAGGDEGNQGVARQSNWVFFSQDDGEAWDGPHLTPVRGIVPDRLAELRSGRWVLSAHTERQPDGSDLWTERCWLSDDRGVTWRGPNTIAAVPGMMLCEGSVAELPGGELVCLMRENSHRGLDAFKSVSRDGGETWGEPVPFPLPGCHRPVVGILASGKALVTYRFCQGGQGWLGWWTQNAFAALTDVESLLAPSREEAHTRILPLDSDRSGASDTGYTGWVQFDDGEIYVVNYIVDDAPKAHIRGYSLCESDFLL